jgi:hypothetical protein
MKFPNLLDDLRAIQNFDLFIQVSLFLENQQKDYDELSNEIDMNNPKDLIDGLCMKMQKQTDRNQVFIEILQVMYFMSEDEHSDSNSTWCELRDHAKMLAYGTNAKQFETSSIQTESKEIRYSSASEKAQIPPAPPMPTFLIPFSSGSGKAQIPPAPPISTFLIPFSKTTGITPPLLILNESQTTRSASPIIKTEHNQQSSDSSPTANSIRQNMSQACNTAQNEIFNSNDRYSVQDLNTADFNLVPKPTKQLKAINWNKVSDESMGKSIVFTFTVFAHKSGIHKVIILKKGNNTIWKDLNSTCERENIDFHLIGELFVKLGDKTIDQTETSNNTDTAYDCIMMGQPNTTSRSESIKPNDNVIKFNYCVRFQSNSDKEKKRVSCI